MFVIIVSVVLLLGWIGYTAGRWRRAENYGEQEVWCMLCLLGSFCPAIVLFLADMLILSIVGLCPDYSSGVREGYVTKVSVKGIVWKTHEIEVQVGTGQMAALQEPHKFSVVDPGLVDALATHIGQRARIRYDQWLILPWSKGASDYLITGIEWAEAPDAR